MNSLCPFSVSFSAFASILLLQAKWIKYGGQVKGQAEIIKQASDDIAGVRGDTETE